MFMNEEDRKYNEVVALLPNTCLAQDVDNDTKNQKVMTIDAATENAAHASVVVKIPFLRELELAPVMMFPQQVSRAMEVRQFLSSVEFIAIHDVIEREDNVMYFVLDVYRYRQQKGLPSTRCNVSAGQLFPPHKRPADHEPKNRDPDYQIEQRYSSFARLCSNVVHIARKHHPRYKSCAYCDGLLDFLHMTPCKPSFKVKYTTTTKERKDILSSFINELVFAAREDYTSCQRSLRGYHIIPALVQRFLLKQTGESFFS
ncbi:unnamed protein product [Peronospora belbahrii]|uniref:PX domain-containing protein n=1 Tax=Peronospora belbahrii TaxID=622444 RepID=A0AAU9LBS9_9STRA|nr:unnamed protein product [Peronospora belbahrii]CAH0516007.1 unnamed protein product [Peronospora belbahrii]